MKDKSVKRPLVLIIMDGLGISGEHEGNAYYQADTPFLDNIFKKHGMTTLRADGLHVGLPEGQMGNSEVGHLNLGAGRVVYQELTRINKDIETGQIASNEVLNALGDKVKARDSSLHLWGLLSDGGVHSHIEHIKALLRLAKEKGVTKVYLHAVTDGRDVPPKVAKKYISEIEDEMKQLGVGQIATVMGRYYAMDRDKRYDRTEKAYNCLVHGKGHQETTAEDAVEQAYERKETDEFITPTRIIDPNQDPDSLVKDGDGVLCFNFRPDRARQLTWAFILPEFEEFDRTPVDVSYVCMTQYDAELSLPIAYPPHAPKNTLGEYLANHGKEQLRIAETEKYAHVTFFFNGGIEEANQNEERILIPSPKVSTYDQQPEMSAAEVTHRMDSELKKKDYDFILLNYANPDMVGHTGDLDAAVKAVATLDRCLGELVPKILEQGGIAVITSDHGNAEKMVDTEENSPHTAHTSHVIPFVIVDNDNRYPLRSGGKLADVAPTVLELMGLPLPQEMSGKSLIDH
ncbi:2,3-bisphosphoglycerate-independent phosphoglycerate mutase [Natranaerobius thermophilus]|uniref:2,3-bisphosphoglycerate-independent phosphoglycerate mutase n=1 Tax=Natranaerobius thermophilus (strain ATCC BAA-1301 / DSM 18059 / JW/NM-WN-LF) TaxID=457570 RepID=B2A6Z2_NATTJ|nr:2,3-bisphosphoglycerate-independent phosphoglycerate mutase [Natranaerobius thermophilus]ACB85583.1 phosphoglycerate mutase [Natranaerobius thermophilus JW/NM-WN-LF]